MATAARSETTNHSRFAGRVAAGLEQPIVLSKKGQNHTRRLPSGEEREILSVGLACSECFSGPKLAKILKPGFDYERQVMADLVLGKSASPLSIHTSGGVAKELTEFVAALEPHLPWTNTEELDWCVSLQLEGASAVWAAIDLVLQETMLRTGDTKRVLVAVGEISYHGPPSTSFGAKCSLWQKSHQVKYPVPIAGAGPIDEEEYLKSFEAFLDKHARELGVILFEPQWGSSQAAFPWPRTLLKNYIKMAKARGIGVVADEIMCGLGRHGQGTLFVSKAWDLDPDAVTFGKAIGGGVYPIAGAVLKQGRQRLCRGGCSVMQSHTYAGSSVRALMTATEVLREVPHWMPSLAKLGEEMAYIFGYLEKVSDGLFVTHGQGLMWGGIFTKDGKMAEPAYRDRAVQCFKKQCDEVGILPYIVPACGFMITPLFDIDVGTIYEIGEKLELVVVRTSDEIGWKKDTIEEAQDAFDLREFLPEHPDLKCKKYLHQTKSCTSCSSFVCPTVRMRFVKYK
mmetsp:Transcript_10688/g.16769  ORF Transcript_10688/g.16769 Transcript_10688/m.16769 type:complete len:511 (+) Transcript_10688:66-1598(+)